MPGRLAGYAGQVSVAGSNISGMKKWTAELKKDTAEGTGFDSGGNREHTPTLFGINGTFEGVKVGAPLTIGSEVTLKLMESATATQNFNGNAIVTGLKPTTTVDGLIEYAYTWLGTGAWTIPTA